MNTLTGFSIFAAPGGFAYGDDIAAGRVLANELRQTIGDALLRTEPFEQLVRSGQGLRTRSVDLAGPPCPLLAQVLTEEVPHHLRQPAADRARIHGRPLQGDGQGLLGQVLGLSSLGPLARALL